jgi:hypothetical protein
MWSLPVELPGNAIQVESGVGRATAMMITADW